MSKVPFFKKNYDISQMELISNVLKSGFLTSGSVGLNVENTLKDYFNINAACLVNSWTNGFMVSLRALKLPFKSEIIVPSITFVACANIPINLGFTLKLADIDPLTGNTNWDHISAEITENTSAILLVHMYGQMLDVEYIRKQLNKIGRSDIKIIEDCAHAFESEFDNSKPGAFSDLALFSFYATKNVSCGEGGAIISNNEKFIERCKSLRLHGMTKNAFDRYSTVKYEHYDVSEAGFKANLPDLLSAMLPYEIQAVDGRRDLREQKYDLYVSELADLDEIGTQKINRNKIKHAHHLMPIFVNPSLRDDLLKYLSLNNIGVAVNFRSISSFTAYSYYTVPNAQLLGNSQISLPFWPEISIEEIKAVVTKVQSYFVASKCH